MESHKQMLDILTPPKKKKVNIMKLFKIIDIDKPINKPKNTNFKKKVRKIKKTY